MKKNKINNNLFIFLKMEKFYASSAYLLHAHEAYLLHNPDHISKANKSHDADRL